MSRKIDRAIHGPSLKEVLFGAVLSLALGVVVGAALLIAKPVEIVKEQPKEVDRRAATVYYIEGSREGSKARLASAKRKSFLEGQNVSVTEDEINSLLPPAKAPPPPPKPDPKKSGDTPASDLLTVGTPNFRIRGGVMQIGVPVNVAVLGVEEKIIVQARGGFARDGNLFVFEPTEFYLGSCPIDQVPFLTGYVRKKFLTGQAIPEDLATAWGKLTSVTIEGNTLKLAMQ